MQSSAPDRVWQAILHHLRTLVTGPVYQTWFDGTVGIAIEGNLLTVNTPNDFVTEYLRSRLAGVVGRAVADVAGADVRVSYRSGTVISEPPPPPLTPPPGAPSAASAPLFSHPVRAPKPMLRPEYTFDRLVVGRCNQVAHSAAVAVAADPGRVYNPLFFFGPTGVGKSHLLTAIGHETLDLGQHVAFVTCDQFINEFVTALRERRADEFRQRYRAADVFLLDDVHQLQGKEQTIEEFFNLFNDLHAAGTQIVLTSDRAPRSLGLIEPRLRSRFEWGLLADVSVPDLETRQAIVRRKAEERQIDLPVEVLDFIAQRSAESVRELEGNLNRVIMFLKVQNKPTSVALAAEALRSIDARPAGRPPVPEAIVEAVCAFYGVREAELTGKGRTARVVRARHVAMFLMHHDAGRALTEIGRALGGRDHSTVLHASTKITAQLERDADLCREVEELRAVLQRRERRAAG